MNGKSKTAMKHPILHIGRCEQRKAFKHFKPPSHYSAENIRKLTHSYY